jgi:hypothetical protein
MNLLESAKVFQGDMVPTQAREGDNSRALVPIQKISPAQMEKRRRRKGLCYSCDAKWNRGHVCEGSKLFLIEEVDTEESLENDEATLQEVEEEELEISLNAITGTPTSKTMRLYGRLKNQQVTMVIDSGSTHNLIDVNLAAVLGIKPDSYESIKVRIANGQEASSSGRSNSLPLRLQGT